MFTHKMLMGAAPKEKGDRKPHMDRLSEWQGLISVIDGTPMSGRDDSLQRAERIAPRVRVVSAAYGTGHNRLKFGSHEMYESVLDVAVDEVLQAIYTTNPDATDESVDAVSTLLLARVENGVMAHGKNSTVASSHHYGALRHLVLPSASGRAVRRLWATVFSFVWTFGNHAAPDEFFAVTDIIRTHVGAADFRLFISVIYAMNRLFGMLSPQLTVRIAAFLNSPSL